MGSFFNLPPLTLTSFHDTISKKKNVIYSSPHDQCQLMTFKSMSLTSVYPGQLPQGSRHL
jgi:hypothetical protein